MEGLESKKHYLASIFSENTTQLSDGLQTEYRTAGSLVAYLALS